MKDHIENTSLQGELMKLSASQISENIRAIEEMRTAIIVAVKNPRNEVKAENKILEACKRLNFCETAFYSYQRAGKNIHGESIHMARMIARYWGNLYYGVSELEQYEDYTSAESFCWDLESNVKKSIKFIVKHERSVNEYVNGDKKKVRKKLDDTRDISELVANMGARKERNCILHSVPAHVIFKAKETAMNTLKHGDGRPLIDRVKELLKWFDDAYQVNVDMIEFYLGHKAAAISHLEYADLRGMAQLLQDGVKTREIIFFDYFKKHDPRQIEKENELGQISQLLGAKQ